MRLVAARDITVADLPYISNPFFAKNDVRDAYCGGFTSIHNLNEFVPVQWRHYQQGLDELLKKIDKMEVCLVYSMKLPFLGVVYWQQDPDYPNNSQKGRWVASLSGINQYANLQGIVSSAYSKIMVPQTHSQQASLQSSTAKAVVNQGFENSVEGDTCKSLPKKQVMTKPEKESLTLGGETGKLPAAFRQTEFASSYEERISKTPAIDNVVVCFEGVRGESLCALKPPPDPDINKILDDVDVSGIEYKNGVPDFSTVSLVEFEIDYMVGGKGSIGTKARNINFSQADEKLVNKLNESPALAGKMGFESGSVTLKDLQKYRKKNNLTWHELNDCKTIQLVPTKINSTFRHLGGVGEVNAGAFEPGGFAI